mgnify:CR=1 FL=1
MEKEPITPQGLEKIKSELQERISVTRPKIVSAISEARAHGDLKENAEYHAAKEEQSHNERRIQEIETTIATANVVDVTKIKNDNKVIFGSTIILLDMENNEKKFTPYQWFVIAILAFIQFTVVLDFMVLSPLGAILMPKMKITVV